jgi:large subunit ribosomal protein L24
MKKLCQGDEVIVVSGRDKGTKGTVIKRVDENYLLVDGVRLAKKHQKPNPAKGISGGVVSVSLPIHQSNVMIFNPATGKPDRVKIKVLQNGKNTRAYVSTGDDIKSVGHVK